MILEGETAGLWKIERHPISRLLNTQSAFLPMNKRTFGESLSHFVRSVDIVDDSTKNDVLGLIEGYLKDELDIRYFTFYIEGSIDQNIGLNSTEWSRGRWSEGDSFTIKDGTGTYQGQVPLAYDRDVPLWIVSADKGPLRLAEAYEDLLLHASPDEIPEYVKKTDYEICTSIIRPIRDGNRIYGIVNFESMRYLDHSLIVEEELKRISDSISTLFLLNKAYKNQRENTNAEINYLAALKNNKDGFLHLSKPKIFIASSSRAEDDVIAVIREVLDEYSDLLDVVFWHDISESGLITHQILKNIKDCHYGICYLSEPGEEGGEYRYQDNDNVLIEAGMLSALSHSAEFDIWIPIREKDSNLLPFDFANNRTITVPRLKTDSALNATSFKTMLKASIKGWITASD